MKKIILIAVGIISVILGIIGIFIPILPTTPFLLLAAYCFANSSDELYAKLINNKYLGSYIKNYKEHKGMKLLDKIIAISFLWLTILYSTIWATELLWLRIGLIAIAIAVSYHLYSINTLNKEKNEKD